MSNPLAESMYDHDNLQGQSLAGQSEQSQEEDIAEFARQFFDIELIPEQIEIIKTVVNNPKDFVVLIPRSYGRTIMMKIAKAYLDNEKV